jgi:hypothetical protein
MTWFGGFVLGLGALVLAALVGAWIRRVVRRRADRRAPDTSYATRLDAEAENGLPDDIGQTADSLIREFGAGAVIEAAERVIPTLSDDDHRSRAVWRQVLKSAEESQRQAQRQKEAAE